MVTGFMFDVMKDKFGNAAISISEFFIAYSPVLKIAAAAISTALKVTSGLHLENIIPLSLLQNAALDFSTASEFLNSYCAQVDSMASDSNSWSRIHASDGIEALTYHQLKAHQTKKSNK
jgi:hypothetical protein